MRSFLLAMAALGLSCASLAAQLPDLSVARSVRVHDDWTGFSPISPTSAWYDLTRDNQGGVTTHAALRVGNGTVRRDTIVTATLPAAAMDSLLRALASVRLDTGRYEPAFTHTDDYPEITLVVGTGAGEVEFYTRSQGEMHTPWRVRAGGHSYVTRDAAIWDATRRVLDRIGGREMRDLTRAVMKARERSSVRSVAAGETLAASGVLYIPAGASCNVQPYTLADR